MQTNVNFISKFKLILLIASTTWLLNGCTALAVTGAVVGAVVGTTVSVGSAVVGTTVDVAQAGVGAVIGSSDPED